MSAESATDTPSSIRKLGLSCAECRRSKLKCDRVFPCQSCIRRGCAGICPEGSLTATKGNKVLMAHAQRLQEEVKTLSARCEELEKELARAKGEDEDLRHLLGPRADKDTIEPVDNVSEGFGSLSIGVDGQATYHGETSSSEYFQDMLPSSDGSTRSANTFIDLPPDMIDLMNAFPFGIRESPYSKRMFLDYIPDSSKARRLAELYFINIGWMYEPITQEDFRTSVLDVIFGPNGEKSVEAAHPHRLSLFFIVLANGCLFHEDPGTAPHGKIYEALARASFSLGSILSEASVFTVQTLFLLVRFIYSADRDRNEERWLLTGLTVRIAHMIGLQRDSANWNLPSEDVQRRRRCFWELFVWDAWTSVVNGRPAGFALQYSDCQFPDDIDPHTERDAEPEMGYHLWKIKYSASVLAASHAFIFTPRTPPYKTLLELDKKIRSFPVPNHLRSPARNNDTTRCWNPDPSRAMMQYLTICLRESNLLYIHRSYFALALKQQPENPLQHAFAASVLATYRSATRLIASLRAVYAVHPQMTSTVWYFWSGIFSSCIVLGALVVESPKCTLALDALRELQAALPFYDEGSRACRSHTTVPLLRKLLERAMTAHSGRSNVPPESSSEIDEFRVLGGHKSILKNTTSSASSASSTVPDTPASRILEDSDDGNSPNGPRNGAMEILHAYYGAIGMQAAPQLELSTSYGSYDSGVARSTHSDRMSITEFPTLPMSNDTLSSYRGPFSGPPASMPASVAGPSQVESYGSIPPTLHQSPAQVPLEQQHHSYYDFSRQSSQGEQWGHPAPIHPSTSGSGQHQTGYRQSQSHPDPLGYGYSNQGPYDYSSQLVDPTWQGRSQPARRAGYEMPVVERTQEEIWRDFMMGYQQPN